MTGAVKTSFAPAAAFDPDRQLLIYCALIRALSYLPCIGRRSDEYFFVQIQLHTPSQADWHLHMIHDQPEKNPVITELLAQCAKKEPGSHDELASAVEHELRKMASNVLQSEPADAFWHTTVLVNETWLRLIDQSGVLRYQNRSHFFCSAATAMRRIMVENARKRISAKRRGQLTQVDVNLLSSRMPDETAIAVHELLGDLAKECPISVQIIEQLYFAGYSKQQTAENLDISEYELNKKWDFSRAWLRKNLSQLPIT